VIYAPPSNTLILLFGYERFTLVLLIYLVTAVGVCTVVLPKLTERRELYYLVAFALIFLLVLMGFIFTGGGGFYFGILGV